MRVEYAKRVLAKEVKYVFMPEDLQRLKKHAWQLATSTSAYLLQCEGVIRARMSSASAPENIVASEASEAVRGVDESRGSD